MIHLGNVVFFESTKQSDVVYASEEDGIMIRCINADKALTDGVVLSYEKKVGDVVIVFISGNS